MPLSVCHTAPAVPCRQAAHTRVDDPCPYTQMPGTLRGYAFLTDVNMDSGRVSRPFVSSLGAFWPGMQALIGWCYCVWSRCLDQAHVPHCLYGCTQGAGVCVCVCVCTHVGQTQDAVDLHANFTAAWQTFGWLPESFTLDLERVRRVTCHQLVMIHSPVNA